MKNYYFLNYKGQFLKDSNLKIKSLIGIWDWEKININDYISANAKDYISQLNITNTQSIFFCGKPNQRSSIHVDGVVADKNYSVWAINYAWQAENSEMIWFNCKKNANGINFFSIYDNITIYDSCDVKEIERMQFSEKLVLVRVDIPHQVINYSSKNRYCLSIRSNFLDLASWDKVVNYFSSYIEE